jgi:hypothetical protein
MARPTKFTEELGDEICSMVMSGMPLVRICESDNMPDPRTVYRWFREHELFCQNYARAKEDQADYFVEDILQIADMAKPDDVQVARLRVDTRKWAASKYKPKKYGDTIKQEITGKDGGAIETRDVTDVMLSYVPQEVLEASLVENKDNN